MPAKIVYYQSQPRGKAAPADPRVVGQPFQESQTSRMNMNVNEPQRHGGPLGVPESSSEECICLREVIGVACPKCGYFGSGVRMSQRCHVHTNVTFIMEMPHCPECKFEGLIEASPQD